MTVAISFNEKLNGIELRFSEIPSSEIIFELKKTMRFRFSKSGNDPRWYATKTQKRIDFANELKRAIESNEEISPMSF
jgi:hypothetical protein